MTRDQLERRLWLALRDLHADRHPWAGNIIQNILDDADLYAAPPPSAVPVLHPTDTLAAIALRREEALAANPLRRRAS